MSLDNYLSRILQLLQVIQQQPKRLQLITWLHKNLSMPNYKPAVCFFELDDNENIRPRAIVGLDGLTLEQLPSVKLEENRPVSNVLRDMKMAVYSKEDLASQNLQIVKESLNLSYRQSEVTKWESAVAIPVGLNKGYSFLFRHDITQIDSALEYLRLLEALLNTYESLVQKEAPTDSKKPILGQEFSNRQEEIFKLIKLGKTNLQIALVLGYSESLIRQETMTIYKKNGIGGRKEILASN